MSLTTEYNNLSCCRPTTANSYKSNNDVGTSNFHKAKLQGALGEYNAACQDNVTIVSSNEDCSEVVFTKPKDKFKLINKIEARLSGTKKFIETGDTLVMTRKWDR